MRRPILGLSLLLLIASAPATEIAAIAYHDIAPMRTGDPYAITLAEFERQMEYLVRHGYQPVSLRTLEAARQGQGALPAKPVLLTFDDGLSSYYEQAYPVLRRYGFPSVVSIVTGWIDRRSAPEDIAATFMTWEQLRELARSPLVEVVSHTDDLHRSLAANGWSARLPAATARAYDAARGTYEEEGAHARRVYADLARSVERLHGELGHAPLAVTWPYGEYDQVTIDAAARLGMRYALTLDRAPTRLSDLPRISRETFRHYRGLGDFDDMLTRRRFHRQQLRLVELDLGPFVARERAAQERLLAQLLNRLELLRVNAVLLNPFSADGKRALFHNRQRPAVVDIVGQVTQQILKRTDVRAIYLRVPVMADAETLYRDLARLNWFNGIVLEGTSTPAAAERVVEIFRHYKPTLRVGVRPPAAIPKPDFTLVELNVATPRGTLAQQTLSLLKEHPQALFLLQRGDETTGAALRAAMDTLRTAGAVHYGYSLDDFERNVPDPVSIVRSLTDFAVTPAR